MKQEDVRLKMEKFLEHLREEQELRDELTSLQVNGVSERELKQALTRQRELVAEIDALRKEKMLPMVAQLSEFVAGKRIEYGLDKPAAPPAKPSPPKKKPAGR